MALHNELGKEGKFIPQQFIEKKGFKIFDCNWRHLRYEVDIIALDKYFLVFVRSKNTLHF